ncbi:MAG: hypothetical protein HY661_02450 [Betaproteobacteria bacterium]|nr:hypothetical protein [Betaproteobacteria bacterium]
MNIQPGALDSGGRITDLLIITAAFIEQEFGRPLAAPFMGAVLGTAGCSKKPFMLPSADAFEAALRDYNPPACTVIGAIGEEDFVATLQAAINRRLHIQSQSSEKK